VVTITCVTWLPRFLFAQSNVPYPILEHVLRGTTSGIAGTLGGIVNYVMSERRNAERQKAPLPPKPAGWVHDMRGDVFIGFVIGIAVYAGGIPDVPFSKIIVTAILGGVSSTKYFSKTNEANEARRQASREKAKSNKLRKATDLALGTSIKQEGVNGGTESIDS
jgi:hypothetical protein